jgi:hypothetical protein
MQTYADGGSDKVAALDAFKITRWPGHEWHLTGLYRWSRKLLTDYVKTLPPHERPQWTSSTALSFSRQSDAISFAAAVEHWASR